MKKIKVISCFVILCIMALIFFFSSQNSDDSTELSSGITLRIAEAIVSLTGTDKITPDGLETILHNFIRKCAHFSEYFLLGASVAVYIRLNIKGPWYKILIYAAAFCMLYAVTDEIHQCFIPGRTPKIFDVFVDTSGAAAGAAVLSAIQSGRNKKKKDGTI